ncbi:bone morphogenetic protein 2-A isoform X2 [Haplochromis burtoni]|uniref:bone morphogenetic protein 2-A isoform X2 n=1 Tax=Haplochromis burtoni TaxID=8153 RepID=UPI0003BC5D9B|nr:bone morphogenetic protein 2-A isoform X2 [Haplochromis burtoni]
MTARAPRLCLLALLLLRCVTPLAIPQDGLGATKMARQKLDRLFYLKDIPRPAVAPQKKAPQFMLDLFNVVSVTDGTPKSQTDILEGNTVRSFSDKGQPGESFHFFNLSSFGRDERMIKAQFRWFRKKRKFYPGSFHTPHFYKVALYEVLENLVKPWRGNLITSRLVPLYTQGWEVFNVTQIVSKWIQNSQEDNGILVVTTLPAGNWMESVLHSSKQNVELTDTSAYLVIFSHDKQTGASNQSYFDLG